MRESFRKPGLATALDRSNEDWVYGLRRRQDHTIRDLRALLVRSLLPVLRERVPAQADAMAEDFAQEALLVIMDRLGTYRHEARFTTWCARIAVRIVLTELRRARWKDVSLESLTSGLDRAEADAGADSLVMRSEASHLVSELIRTELTDRQRSALLAVMVGGMPLGEVARRLGTNRNALYKLLHDARRRLRQAIDDRGLTADDLGSGLL